MTKEKCCKQKNKILNKGFTLIELLVVVLIIGVLAAISVTQYKKSVLKSKYSTLLPLTKALHDSQEMFDLTRGYYTDNFSDLELPGNATVNEDIATVNNNTFTLGNNKRHIYIKATKSGLNNNYVMYQSKSKYFPNEIHCEAKTDNYLANWLCKDELGGTKLDRSLTEGYTDYVITGTGNGFFPIDWIDEHGTGGNSRFNISNGDTCTSTEEYGCWNVNCTNCSVQANNIYSGADSKFTNATCEGNGNDTCRTSSFTNSTCIGNGKFSCGGGNQTRYSTFNNSVCIGNNAKACNGNTFKGNSICYANVEGACGTYCSNTGCHESTYEDDACCSGQYCPDYAPKCS